MPGFVVLLVASRVLNHERIRLTDRRSRGQPSGDSDPLVISIGLAFLASFKARIDLLLAVLYQLTSIGECVINQFLIH